MIVYTAEDFAQAMFAVHPDPDAVDARYAARMNRDPEYPWLLDGVPGNGDEHMARDGWVPVVEADGPVVTEGTLRHVEERAERKRERLIRHTEDLNAAMRRKNEQIKLQNAKLGAAEARIKELLARCASLEDDCSHLIEERESPLSLHTLEVAWGAAEVPTDDNPIREGDVLIVRHGGGFAVEPADRILSGQTHGRERILSRAPKREPHENLADAIREVWPSAYDEIDIGSLAYALHERGVRMTGGDES